MRPVLFQIGPYPVYSYGLMILVAFTVGTVIGRSYLVRRGIEAYHAYYVAAVVALSGLVGSRVFYVFGHLGEFRGNWSSVFDFESRGLVFYGGLIFAIAFGYLVVRIRRLPAGVFANAAGYAVFPSIAIARVGCFLNGCCGGKPSSMPWAVTFPGYPKPVHPTQLYELAFDLVAFSIIVILAKRLSGGWQLLYASVGSYAAIRFIVEFFRYHENRYAGPVFQFLSASLLILCVALLIRAKRKQKNEEVYKDPSGESGSFLS